MAVERYTTYILVATSTIVSGSHSQVISESHSQALCTRSLQKHGQFYIAFLCDIEGWKREVGYKIAKEIHIPGKHSLRQR